MIYGGKYSLKQFVKIFKKVNGKEIIKQYIHAHVLIFALLEMLHLGVSKKSLEILRLAVNNKILIKLKKRYRNYINQYLFDHKEEVPKIRSNKVWVCWLQGLDNAPTIVQKCYQSLTEKLSNREVILITVDNYKKYIIFPDYIQKKIEKGIISKTHMSDLLRLELLTRYGGTWIDATVLCVSENIPDYMINSDLFMFQNLKPGVDGHPLRISNWFITSCTNEPILTLTLSLLYDYWKNHNQLVDYFIFHDFCELAIDAYPEEWSRVVPFSNSTSHILLLRLFYQYDDDMWDNIKEMVPFHKLSYKFDETQYHKKGTYYDAIINRIGGFE